MSSQSKTIIQQIDNQLRPYYHNLGHDEYYDNEQEKGKFAIWCEDNEYDDKLIEEDLNGDLYSSVCVDFDDRFPVRCDTKHRAETIFKILKNMSLASGLDLLDVNQFNLTVTEQQMQETRRIFNHQIKTWGIDDGYTQLNNINILYMVTVTRIYPNQNLGPNIIDSCKRNMVAQALQFEMNNSAIQHKPIENWISKHPFLQQLDFAMKKISLDSSKLGRKDTHENERIQLDLKSILYKYQKRIAKPLRPFGGQLINGNLQMISKYIVASSKFLTHIIDKETYHIGGPPFLFDFMILLNPCVSVQTNIDNDTDDDDDDIYDAGFIHLSSDDETIVKQKSEFTQTIDATKAAQGQILTFSYHVWEADQIKCYLLWNGQCHRFYPQDILELLPHLFIKTDENIAFAVSDEIKTLASGMKIRDIKFEKFYRRLNGLTEYEFPKQSHDFQPGVASQTDHRANNIRRDIIGNVIDRLEANNCKFSRRDIDQETDEELFEIQAAKTMRYAFTALREQLNIKAKWSYPQNCRFNMIVDRRNTKDELILFEPPQNCNRLLKANIAEAYFELSRRCLIPGTDSVIKSGKNGNVGLQTNLSKDKYNSYASSDKLIVNKILLSDSDNDHYDGDEFVMNRSTTEKRKKILPDTEIQPLKLIQKKSNDLKHVISSKTQKTAEQNDNNYDYEEFSCMTASGGNGDGGDGEKRRNRNNGKKTDWINIPEKEEESESDDINDKIIDVKHSKLNATALEFTPESKLSKSKSVDNDHTFGVDCNICRGQGHTTYENKKYCDVCWQTFCQHDVKQQTSACKDEVKSANYLAEHINSDFKQMYSDSSPDMRYVLESIAQEMKVNIIETLMNELKKMKQEHCQVQKQLSELKHKFEKLQQCQISDKAINEKSNMKQPTEIHYTFNTSTVKINNNCSASQPLSESNTIQSINKGVLYEKKVENRLHSLHINTSKHKEQQIVESIHNMNDINPLQNNNHLHKFNIRIFNNSNSLNNQQKSNNCDQNNNTNILYHQQHKENQNTHHQKRNVNVSITTQNINENNKHKENNNNNQYESIEKDYKQIMDYKKIIVIPSKHVETFRSKIHETFKDTTMFVYYLKYTINMQINDSFAKIYHMDNGLIIFNTDLHERVSSKKIYCVAKRFQKSSKWKWKVNQLITADELSIKYNITENLPLSSRNKDSFTSELQQKLKLPPLIIGDLSLKNVFVIKGKAKGGKPNDETLKNMLRSVSTTDQKNLKQIVRFKIKGKKHWIEHVLICTYFNEKKQNMTFGVSFKQTNDSYIITIFLDTMDIERQNKLIGNH